MNCQNFRGLTSFKSRGRYFTIGELQHLAEIVEQYFDEGRTSISRHICRSLGWVQPNGRLKDVACREILRKLNEAGHIRLPPPRGSGAVWKHPKCSESVSQHTTLITSIDFRKLILKRATSKEDIKLWNYLVCTFHYLHTSRIVGRQIKYIAFSEERPVACLGWGDGSWMVRARDQWTGWTVDQLSRNRHLIINNVRFLVLPWVKVQNLASHLLSKCASKVASDWYMKYGYRPVLLETFVDVERFSGTCYRAANWICLGLTAGYAKVGSSHHNSQKPKAIFVYPIGRHSHDELRRH
jgi:hypothetical protein